jgi:hypothetical protein
MELGNVRRDDWIVAALALLLFVDLVGFPWFSGYQLDFVGTTISLTATDAPDSWLGVLAALGALAVIADLAVDRLASTTDLPSLNGSRAMTRLLIAAAAAALLALKFLLSLGHFGELGVGCWAALVLAAALVTMTKRERDVETAARHVR